MSARLRRLIGRFALVTFMGTLAMPMLALVHISWNDDPTCESDELGPRHAAAQVEAPQAPTAAGHCAVCHWMRAITGAAPTVSVSVHSVLTPYELRVATPNAWSGQASLFERPSRAPPAFSTL